MKRGRAILSVAVFAVLAGGLVMVPKASAEPYKTAILQGLDKVTARVTTLRANVGESVRFGTLDIIVRYCDKRPPEDPPESAAFLDISEIRQGAAAVSLFRGWMFASSPGLNALEHPVYDVWVLGCEDKLSSASDKISPKGPPPKGMLGN